MAFYFLVHIYHHVRLAIIASARRTPFRVDHSYRYMGWLLTIIDPPSYHHCLPGIYACVSIIVRTLFVGLRAVLYGCRALLVRRVGITILSACCALHIRAEDVYFGASYTPRVAGPRSFSLHGRIHSEPLCCVERISMILALLGYSSLFEDVPFNSILPDYKMGPGPQIELCRRDSFRSNLAHFLHKRPSHSLHALRGSRVACRDGWCCSSQTSIMIPCR